MHREDIGKPRSTVACLWFSEITQGDLGTISENFQQLTTSATTLNLFFNGTFMT